MNRPEALQALLSARVGHLATTRPGGTPHIVPITFAVLNEILVTMIDHKPKTTRHLQRLINLEHNPRASVVVDRYSEDWSDLWWVRVDGPASIHEEGEKWESSREGLAAKYEQYAQTPPEGPAIVIVMEKLSWWASTP